MGRKSYFEINKSEILNEFNRHPYYYSSKDILQTLHSLKDKSLVPDSLYFDGFLKALIDEGLISYTIKIKGHYYTRYSFENEFNHYRFGTNLLGSRSFLSMTTSLNFQSLTNYRNEILFISNELTLKAASLNNSIKQVDVDKAFRNTMPRYTNNIGEYEGKNYILLNPKFSNNYEVLQTLEGTRYSSVNRVLVEMIINSHYFKTDTVIINIFKPLKDLLDIKKIYKIIDKLEYIYPYFQCAGYYLEQIGFDKKELLAFKNKVSDIDFYTQKMKLQIVEKDYEYNNYWRMYY